MNRLGIHYAFWEHHWNTDLVPPVLKAKQLGFDVLEVNPGTVVRMKETERDRLKHEAANRGIELTYCIGLPRQYDIASADTNVRRRGIKYLKSQVEMLKYMGGKALSGILYGWWPTSVSAGEVDKGPALDRSIQSMREVMKFVEDNDVVFNLEVVNRFEQFLFNTAREAVDYVNRVGSSRCKILLDTFHMNIEEDSFEQAIITAGNKLGHFHVGESNRRPPGNGKIPWDEIVEALGTIGYQGDIVMEPFIMPGGEVGRDIRVYRDLCGGASLDDQARKACAFIKDKLSSHSH